MRSCRCFANSALSTFGSIASNPASTSIVSSASTVDDAADVILADAGIETATGALSERDDLMERIEDLDRDLYEHDDSGEAYVLGLVLDSLWRTTQYGANVAEVALQQFTRWDRTLIDPNVPTRDPFHDVAATELQ
jgi:hypothetical protein